LTSTAPTPSLHRPVFAAPEVADADQRFGQWLLDYRHAAGLTQRELAARAHVSERTILKLETGVGVVPRRSTVTRLAVALGLEDEARAAFLALATDGQRPRVTPPHNLPAPRTAFIGRVGSQRAITRLLTGRTRHRLITLVGPGGVGKTRLAVQVATPLLPAFPDGVWFIDLAASAEATSVADTIAMVIGLRDRPGQQTLDTLVDELRERRTLLILDNCEQLRAPVAELAAALLARTRDVQLLATSREALGLSGEMARRVAPLPLPEQGDTPLTVEALLRSTAAQLFCERARLADLDFAVTPANTATIATLCARLDGLPLLLELAAAQLSTRPLAALADDLADTLRPLPARRRGGVARQQNVRALLDWSYALLTPTERILLRRLAPFVGGWTREAVHAVCAGPDLPDPDAALDRLVAQSLVLEEHTHTAPPRYRLLETIRHDAEIRLQAAGEAERIAERLCAWCITLAESCAYPLDGGPEGRAWLERLAPEVGNIRAAYAWADAHDPASGLRLATACWAYGFIRMNHLDSRARLDQFFGRATMTDRQRAQALYARGMFSLANELRVSHADLTEALILAEATGDSDLATAIRWPLAFAALSLDRLDQAARLLDEGWTLVADAPQLGRRAPYRLTRGSLALARGDRDTGEAELRQADADAQAAEQPLFRCMALARLVQAQLLRGDADGARATCATLLAVAHAIGSSFYRFVGYYRLGMVEEWAGELDAADSAYTESQRYSSSASAGSLDRATVALWRARRASYQGQPLLALAALDEADAVIANFALAPMRRETAILRGLALWRCGRFAEARAQLLVALPLIANDDPAFHAGCLESLASIASGAGEPAAARWLAAATALRVRTGRPQRRTDAPRAARTEAALRALLPPDALAAALDPANAPTFEEALAEAEAWLRASRES
jgi:predicted ATPase/DNA-binding XRE family transcriptional regulator